MAEKPIFARIHFSRAPVCTLLISGGKAVCRSYRIIHLVEGRSALDLDSKTDNSKVRDYLKNKSSLKSKADWFTVLDGNQEGAYQWVTINYLLENLGKKYSSTVGVVDLGGGSVPMAYAVSESDAAKAPKLSGGEESYVQQMYLKGRKYYLYIHRNPANDLSNVSYLQLPTLRFTGCSS